MLTENVKVARRNTDANCFGTALYLAGKKSEDRRVNIDYLGIELNQYLEEEPLLKPELHCAALFWCCGLLVHMGIVTDPLSKKMIHRNPACGPLFENDDIDEIARKYKSVVVYRKFKETSSTTN